MQSMETSDSLVAGFSLQCSRYMASSELTAKLALSKNMTPVVAESEQVPEQQAAQTPEAEQIPEQQPSEPVNPFADIAIAQVNNYVNVRSEPSEESEILGKLYNNSAATVHETVDGWYQITSGTVTGYVKSEYVVVGNEELARSVGRRVATVNEDAVTLFVRLEPSTEAGKLGMVASLDSLTVLDESVEGWVKVSIEEGEGYVSADYVTLSTEFVQAESKEEEEARLAKEARERQEAEEAARRKLAAQSSGSSSGSGS
ncbi:MAG: SH3 domain-containing protein [Lachnospiraceae bacterium]|nr:SH3 domain-containing protein [Lachnospiraceae bacterium]